MSKTWKWVLGTVLVLIVIAAIVCTHTYMGGFMRDGGGARGMFQSNGWGDFDKHEKMMNGANGCAGPGSMMGDEYGFAGPGSMMRGHGFMSPMFGFGFMFLRGLFPLVLLGLLVYAAYRMGLKRSNTQASTMVTTSEVAAESTASEPVEGKTCRKCGGMVQAEWRNCPHCGTKQ